MERDYSICQGQSVQYRASNALPDQHRLLHQALTLASPIIYKGNGIYCVPCADGKYYELDTSNTVVEINDCPVDHLDYIRTWEACQP